MQCVAPYGCAWGALQCSSSSVQVARLTDAHGWRLMNADNCGVVSVSTSNTTGPTAAGDCVLRQGQCLCPASQVQDGRLFYLSDRPGHPLEASECKSTRALLQRQKWRLASVLQAAKVQQFCKIGPSCSADAHCHVLSTADGSRSVPRSLFSSRCETAPRSPR